MTFLRPRAAVWHRVLRVYPCYAAIYVACYGLATMLRFDFSPDATIWNRCAAQIPLVLLVKSIIFFYSGEWQRRHRYTSLPDLVHMSGVVAVSSTVLAALNFALGAGVHIPRSILCIDAALTLLAVGAFRAGLRVLFNSPRVVRTESQTRALVYANCDDAFIILRGLRDSAQSICVVGIYEEDAAPKTMRVAGVPVFGPPRALHRVAHRLGATSVIVPSSIAGKELRELIHDCRSNDLEVHVIPAAEEIVAGRYKLGLRDVNIADLLRREPTQLDFDAIRGYVTGRRVLVTGAAGSIGSELCRQILDLRPAELSLLDQSEAGIFQIEQEFLGRDKGDVELSYIIADITDADCIRAVLNERQPEIMFHAAAYKHVPLMEQNPREAVRNNVFGTKTLVDLASEHNVERFVLISTDKAVRPTSLMGATKLLAEKYLQAVAAKSSTRFITVRFGNVLNSAGSVVPTFRRQIEAGGPITVTHPDMVRFFMTIPEAVQLVLQAGAVGDSGDVLILDMGDPVKIVDLAKDMILLSGLRYPDDIDITFSGIRPGEKLYEELFYETETGSQRVHEKIFRGQHPALPFSLIASHLAKLKSTLNQPPAEVHRLVMNIAHSFADADSQVAAPARAA